MKYQIGEVVRFSETGSLYTIVDVYSESFAYMVSDGSGITRWFDEDELEPVNGDMKSAEESASEPLSFSTRSLCDAVRTMNDDDLEALYAAVEEESQRRDEQQQRKLAGAIVSAMDAYLRKIGDNRDFYCTEWVATATLQQMHDAIVSEFDLTAQ